MSPLPETTSNLPVVASTWNCRPEESARVALELPFSVMPPLVVLTSILSLPFAIRYRPPCQPLLPVLWALASNKILPLLLSRATL